jgi:hypothetical protein
MDRFAGRHPLILLSVAAPSKARSAGFLSEDNRELAVEPDADPAQYLRPVYALPMANAALSRRVGKVVAYPPFSELSDRERREFHEALLDAEAFEDLSGKWQAAIVKAEQNRPDLRIVGRG